jgi:hypothetical protein
MITDFKPILDQSEIDVLVSKLAQMRHYQGLEPSWDEILYLVSFARKLKVYSPPMLTFILVADCWIDVKFDELNSDRTMVNLVIWNEDK